MTGNVSVGVTTRAGYGATALGLIGAVLALVWPDMPQQQMAVIASSVLTLAGFGFTQVFRYLQALELARHAPILEAISPLLRPTPAKVAPAVKSPTAVIVTAVKPRPSVDVPPDIPPLLEGEDETRIGHNAGAPPMTGASS